MYQSAADVREHDAGVREAIRYGAVFIALGIGFLVVAALWIGTCGGATADTIACGAPQRTFLALGAPAILLIGGLRALVRTHQSKISSESRVAWQGAGAFLLVMMVVSLATGLPSFAAFFS